MTAEKKMTPMMEQWHLCKQKACDAILLFRLGDFYEAFYDDAVMLSQLLDLTLTQRHGIPMSGIPYLSLDTYVDRLVAKGIKVAIAEQQHELDKGKNAPISRDIHRFITPGTLLQSSLLDDKENNFIISLNQVGSLYGLAIIDLSIGSFILNEFDHVKELQDEILRLRPSECLTSHKFAEKHHEWLLQISESTSCSLSTHTDWAFEHQSAYSKLTQQYQVASLDGYGLKGLVASINAAGGLLSYLKDRLLVPTDHLATPQLHQKQRYLMMDSATQANLELIASQDQHSKHSLLHTMDHTLTPMGGRLLRYILLHPFCQKEEITQRHDAVDFFMKHLPLKNALISSLKQIRDVERIVTKITTSVASPKDIGILKDSLQAGLHVISTMHDYELPMFFKQQRLQNVPELASLSTLLQQALNDPPPLRILDGNIFQDSYHTELAQLRHNAQHAHEWVAQYQERLRLETNLRKLKVGFNQSLGYYIELQHDSRLEIPSYFIRRQSRLHAQRFTTPELQAFEYEMTHVEEKIKHLETQLFKDLCHQILQNKHAILQLAHIIGHIDYILSLATLAITHHYCRPIIDHSRRLHIYAGRHPVIESLLPAGTFIPNDMELNDHNTQVILLTGPNMAGKSTYIRQNALLVIMAQMGSFIPAKSAYIGIVDRIFTRIGAGDNLSKGLSTFMVEMTETANILNNATTSSLVILDEIGRGTSTYDGLAIAQAVLEYLLHTEGKQAKTLFATHYKELTSLSKTTPHLKNFHASVKEGSGHPTFLYEIKPGYAHKSFGIHVAKLAGFPLSVISRAQQILSQLEGPDTSRPLQEKAQQLTLF